MWRWLEVDETTKESCRRAGGVLDAGGPKDCVLAIALNVAVIVGSACYLDTHYPRQPPTPAAHQVANRGTR